MSSFSSRENTEISRWPSRENTIMDCTGRFPKPQSSTQSSTQELREISASLAQIHSLVESERASNRAMEQQLIKVSKYQDMMYATNSPTIDDFDKLLQKRLNESMADMLHNWSNSHDAKLLRHDILRQEQCSQQLEALANLERVVQQLAGKQELQSTSTEKSKDPWALLGESRIQELSNDLVAEVVDKVGDRLERVLARDRLHKKITNLFSDQKSSNSTETGFVSEMNAPKQIGFTSCALADITPKEGGVAGATQMSAVSENIQSSLLHDTKAENEPDPEANASTKEFRKMNMAVNHNLPNIYLAENGSLGGVFTSDTDLSRPVHNVEYYYFKTGICQKIARTSAFNNFTILVVLLNAVFLAIDSDYNYNPNIYNAEWQFLLPSQFFAFYFTGEILVRFLAFEKKHDCFRDGWFRFDLFLVATMILDIWVIMLAIKLFMGGGNVKIPFQPLRILRLFKLTRMARLIKAFPELMVVIKSLGKSLRAAFSSMFLLLVLVYSVAICLHLLLRKEKAFNAQLLNETGYNFGTIGHCMWTLLISGTLLLDNSAVLMDRLVFADQLGFKLAGVLFLSFTFLSAMLILQMLIGVLCDVVSQVNEERREADCIGLVKQELMGYLNQVDKGGDGKISREELSEMFDQPNTEALLKALNINKGFFLQMCHLTFLSDDDGVPICSILELMVMCRGENVVNVNIMASVLCLLNNHIGDVQDTLATGEGHFALHRIPGT